MVAEQDRSKEKRVFYLSSCDTDIIREHLETILQQLRSLQNLQDNQRTVLLGSKKQLTCMPHIQGYFQFFATLCRKYNLLKNDRMTLLSPMDQLIAIQLCLAEKNKEDKGDFDVEASIVLQASKDINKKKLSPDYDVTSYTEETGISDRYRKFMDNCNYVDSCDVFVKVKEEIVSNEELRKEIDELNIVVLDAPKSPVEQNMAELLCHGKSFHTVTVEVPLSGDESISVVVKEGNIADILTEKAPISTVKKPPSVTEAYVQLVFVSYLDLLANSRSELSLARVFNVPERELTHTAFTSLKHESVQKKMTMYQTATSYVMKLRLGGKGYAPDPNNGLQAYIKGIGEFVSLMQRMETVIEEDPDIRSACKRTVNIIKKELIKCRDSRIRNSSVETVAEKLLSQVSLIIDQLDSNLFTTPDKAPANGGSLTSRRARKAIRLTLDKLASVDGDFSTLDHLTDIYSSQRTPLRFPSVLSQFRSPEEELEVTSPDNKFTLSLSERVMNRMNQPMTPVYAKRYKSTMDWAEPLHKVDLRQEEDIFSSSQTYVIPSKTIVHAGTKFSSGEAQKVLESMLDKENLTGTDIETVPLTKKGDNIKRSLGNHTAQSINNCAKEKQNQSKKRPAEEDNQSSQSLQPTKKKKETQAKGCRRKLLPQVKGQPQLTKFFRV